MSPLYPDPDRHCSYIVINQSCVSVEGLKVKKTMIMIWSLNVLYSIFSSARFDRDE